LNEKILRAKYRRVLEKFVKKTISILKKDEFHLEHYYATIENYEKELKKIEKIRLNSAYLTALENYANLLVFLKLNHTNSFKEERELLLKQANLLHKEKNKTIYKKTKHRKNDYNDGY
jgi:predicted RND superfamily exporter protein